MYSVEHVTRVKVWFIHIKPSEFRSETGKHRQDLCRKGSRQNSGSSLFLDLFFGSFLGSSTDSEAQNP